MKCQNISHDSPMTMHPRCGPARLQAPDQGCEGEGAAAKGLRHRKLEENGAGEHFMMNCIWTTITTSSVIQRCLDAVGGLVVRLFRSFPFATFNLCLHFVTVSKRHYRWTDVLFEIVAPSFHAPSRVPTTQK